MGSGLGDSLSINIEDALTLAKGMRGYAADAAYGTVPPSSFGAAANTVTAGFAGFRIGGVCSTKSADTASANRSLSDALQAIGDNTVKCVDAFHHTDHATQLQIEGLTTWQTGS